MTRINYKSDFDFILALTGQDGQSTGFPAHDWEATFWTTSKANAFTASCIGGQCAGCFNDEGQIHIVADSHGLGPGTLRMDFHIVMPNGIYPDGTQDIYRPQTIGIELVTGSGDTAGSVEAEAMLPYLQGPKGDKGDPGPKGDKGEPGQGLTDAQIAAILAAADKAERASRQAVIDLFNAGAGKYGGYNEQTGLFELHGITDIGYDEALQIIRYSPASITGNISGLLAGFTGRTLFHMPSTDTKSTDCISAFLCPTIEYLSFGYLQPTDGKHIFYNAKKLRVINGNIWLNLKPPHMATAFTGCESLEEVRIYRLYTDVDLRWSPRLSIASIESFIANIGASPSPVTVTLHPDAHARLTSDIIDRAAAVKLTFATNATPG